MTEGEGCKRREDEEGEDNRARKRGRRDLLRPDRGGSQGAGFCYPSVDDVHRRNDDGRWKSNHQDISTSKAIWESRTGWRSLTSRRQLEEGLAGYTNATSTQAQTPQAAPSIPYTTLLITCGILNPELPSVQGVLVRPDKTAHLVSSGSERLRPMGPEHRSRWAKHLVLVYESCHSKAWLALSTAGRKDRGLRAAYTYRYTRK